MEAWNEKGNMRTYGPTPLASFQHLTHSRSPLTNRTPTDNIPTIIPTSPMYIVFW